MFNFDNNRDTELDDDYTAKNFDFGKFRKTVSKAADSVVDAINNTDFSKTDKKDDKDMPETMSTFFAAAADMLADATSTKKQVVADEDVALPASTGLLSNFSSLADNLLSPSKNTNLLDQASARLSDLSGTASDTVKNAKLDKKASNLLGQTSDTLSSLTGNVSGTVKKAKLDKKASQLLGQASDTLSGLTDTVKSANTPSLLDKATGSFGNLTDSVSGTIKDAKLDKKASDLVDTIKGVELDKKVADLTSKATDGLATGVASLAETATGVAGSVVGAVLEAKLDKKAADLLDTVKNTDLTKKTSPILDTIKAAELDKKAMKLANDTTSNVSDSVNSFVKKNKLDKKAATLATTAGQTLSDAKLDEKLFGAFNLVPGVEVKNPKKAAKQFRKRRAQAMKKVQSQQKELGKFLATNQKQAAKVVNTAQKTLKDKGISVPDVKLQQEDKGGFPIGKTLAVAGIAAGGIAFNNARIWSNVPPLENPLPGEGHFYRSRQGMVYYKVAGEVTGDEHPVVFVHGIGAGNHSYEWSQNFGQLATLYKCYAFDLLGFGNSERPNINYTAEVYIKQLTEFLDEVVGQPAYVVASSLAASYAVQVAYRRPELIDKLLMVEPTGLDAKSGTGGAEVVSSAFYGVLRAPLIDKSIYSWVASNSGIRSFMENQMFYDKSIVTDKMVQQYWTSAHQDGAQYPIPSFFTGKLNAELAQTIGKLDIPMLAVFGKESRITPPRQGRSLLDENKAIQIQVLDNARLSVNWERADKFNDLALDFLDNANQTNVGTKARVHELKVSDIAGVGFVHPGTAQAMEDIQEPTQDAAQEAARPADNNQAQGKQNNQSNNNDFNQNGNNQPQAQG